MACLVDNMARYQRIGDERQSEWLVDCEPNWDQWYAEKSAWGCELNDYESVAIILLLFYCSKSLKESWFNLYSDMQKRPMCWNLSITVTDLLIEMLKM